MECIMADEATLPATVVAPTTQAPAVTAPVAGAPVRLPDDHPLVTAFSKQKAELADAKTRLQGIDDANKTDAQKQADALAALQKENESLKVATLRVGVAVTKGVDADLLTGSTKEELEASADKLNAWKGTAAPGLKPNTRTAGPTGQVQATEETREDRLKRLKDADL